MLCMVYQNVHHSFQPSTNHPSTLQTIQNLQDLECSIFCASKTNVNWQQPATKYHMRQNFQCAYTQVHISATASKLGNAPAHQHKWHLLGGSTVFTLDHWATKVIKSGKDPQGLGRWSYTTICGCNQKLLTLISEIPFETRVAHKTRYLLAWLNQITQKRQITIAEQHQDQEGYGSITRCFCQAPPRNGQEEHQQQSNTVNVTQPASSNVFCFILHSTNQHQYSVSYPAPSHIPYPLFL